MTFLGWGPMQGSLTFGMNSIGYAALVFSVQQKKRLVNIRVKIVTVSNPQTQTCTPEKSFE
jgi:hypothetical protein